MLNYDHLDILAGLIWCLVDVENAMENAGIELTQENFERALDAVESEDFELETQQINETIYNAVTEEFGV